MRFNINVKDLTGNEALLLEEFLHLFWAVGIYKTIETTVESLHRDEYFKNGQKKKYPKVTYSVEGYMVMR